MFQSLNHAALLSAVAQVIPDASDAGDWDAPVAILLLIGLLGGVVYYCFKAAPALAASRVPEISHFAPARRAGLRRQAPRSTRNASVQLISERPCDSEPPPSSTRPRLIFLYEVTPGQTSYEYNLGDSAGRRGVVPGWSRSRY